MIDTFIDVLYVADVDLIYFIGLNLAEDDMLVKFLAETSRIKRKEPDLDAAEFAELAILTDEELQKECKDAQVRAKRKKQLITLIRNTNSTNDIKACIRLKKWRKMA